MSHSIVQRRPPIRAIAAIVAALLMSSTLTARAASKTAAPKSSDGDAPPAAAKPADDAAKPDDPNPPADQLGESRLIRVRLPLTGNADSHLITVIKRVVEELSHAPKHDNRLPTLVLELSPKHGGAGEGTDFTRALSLANFLTQPEMSAVKTVAYIPNTIKGHGVLIALACDQIAMSPTAELGNAASDEDASRPIDPKIRSAYQDIASAKRTVPLAIALGMVDRRVEVLKVETDQGVEFTTREGLDELKKNHTIISQDVTVPAGSLASVTGREGREFGVLLANDVDALARGISVPAPSLKVDQSMMGDWRPVQMRLEGPITRRKVHQMKTMLGEELAKRKVNWICITIDSTGGNLDDCKELAETIAAFGDDVQTVAYVPVEATGGAALIALSCDQLVMQPEAHLGSEQAHPFDKMETEAARESIRESLARRLPHSWSMLTAFIDPEIELFSYQNTKTGEVRYFSPDEAKNQSEPDNWKRGARIKSPGKTLSLKSTRAKELGIATHVVDNYDDLKQVYGIESDIRTAEPNWALEFVEALSSPALAVLLLVIGFVGVYIELHSPGAGIGGFVAAVAFLLFFWSEFLHGTADWLEVLLFLGGIFCILIEVLVLPGLAIFGLGGGAMVLASLILATQTFILPRTESQMVELRHSLTIVASACLIVVGTSIALRRYLPSAPIFRKLLLTPTPEEDLIDLDYRESLADFSHLIGQQGVAATNLMPAGKAEFDGQLIDVIADGLPIDRGTAIVVVKTRGNRVLVHAVET